MTDTSTEAVERLAASIERHQNRKSAAHKADPRYAAPDERYVKVPVVLSALAAERDALKAEVERLQSVNELMCAQIDSLPPPEPDLLKRQLRKVADKRVRAALQEKTDD